MLNCPFCSAELGASSDRLRGGRCPRCGSILSWEEDASAPPKDEDSLPMSEIVRTLVERGVSASQASATITNLPPSDLAPLRTPTAAFSSAFVMPPGLEKRLEPPTTPPSVPPPPIDQVWRGALTVAALPSMTIKAVESDPDAAISDVLVRPFRLGQPGEASGHGAEYELQEVIGEGGVGLVYAARQASVDRVVAVKMLRDEFAHKRDHRNKFLSEAVVTGELDHPNIVPIYDLGTSDVGSLFYSMKRVKGTPWCDVIRQKSLAENLRILMSVANAIAFAHSRGVVHRDLKPENVMLGDFGEVLVMDWGIALSTNLMVKDGRISQSASMGGTPAYMAPEMATGPIETIGPCSDVYLLGAILYEIVTSRPPHYGQDVMSCLYAAARNEIAPTDKSGELLNIAMKAMSTLPADRHPSVQAFQSAIHEYQSHSESTALSERAEQDLAEARRTEDYQDFSRALFAFQEARSLWLDNEHAKHGEIDAKLAYAGMALKKGDFDLGISLLDDRQSEQAALKKRLTAAQRERNARQDRIRALRRMAIGMAALIFVILGGGLLFISGQYRRIGRINKDLSQTIGDLNVAQTKLENEKKNVEAANSELTKTQSRLVNSNVALVAAKQSAISEAQTARQEEQNAAAASYRAQIGVAAERIDNNAFRDAQRLLNDYQASQWSYFRHWEWGYLKQLCGLQLAEQDVGSRVESLARSPDGKLVALGTASGQVVILDVQAEASQFKRVQELAVGGPVQAICFSPDGKTVAFAGQFDRGQIHFARRNGNGFTRDSQSLAGNSAGVLGLTFAPAGDELVSTSRDGAVTLWNLPTQEVRQSFFGHSGPVWNAAFNPADGSIVTGGDDATVRIWNKTTGEARIYRGHASPVYAVACSPQGTWIASAGRDRDIQIWKTTKNLRVKYDEIVRDLVQSRAAANVAATPAAFHTADIRLSGHSADVRDLSFSSDGLVLLSSGDDNTVRRWEFTTDAKNPSFSTVLRGHGGWVRGSALGADSRFVVSGSLDGSVKLWDAHDYQEVKVLRGHEDAVNWASYSRDGKRVITASRDRRALVWNRATREPLMVFDEGDQAADPNEPGLSARLKEGHDFLATSAAFLPDGQRMVTSAGDGTVRIWDRSTSGQLHRIKDTGTLGTLAVSHDGRWLVTGSASTAAQLWQLDSLSAAPVTLSGHKGDVSAAAFSPPSASSSLKIVTGDVLGNVRIWSLPADSNAIRSEGQLTGHSPGYGITALRFTPDGRRVFSAGQDHTVLVHDASTAERLPLVLRHPGSVHNLDLSANGAWAITLSHSGKDEQRATLWDANNGTQIRTCDVSMRGRSVTSIAFHPQQQSAVLTSTGDRRSHLWKWDLSATTLAPMWNGRELRGAIWSATLSADGQRIITIGGSQARMYRTESGDLERAFSPHGPLTAAAFSPLGRLVATSSSDGDVKIWSADPADGDYGRVRLRMVRPHATSSGSVGVNFVEFAPQETSDEAKLVTAGDDGTARVWQITNTAASPLATLAGHAARVRSAVFSPDGKLLLTASDDRTARLWNLETAQPATLFGGKLPHVEAVLFATFSPDGTLAITGCDDNNAYVWDLASTGDTTHRLILQGHTAAVTSAAISPDGRRAVTGSQDGIAKLWDLETGKEILSLKRHLAELTSVHFSPDGSSILTSSRDQTALEWPAAKIGPSLKLSSARLEIGGGSGAHVVDPQARLFSPDSDDLGGLTIAVRLTSDSQAPRSATLVLAQDAANDRDIATTSTDQDGMSLSMKLATGATRNDAERLIRAVNLRLTQPLDQPLTIQFEILDAAGKQINETRAILQPAESQQPVALAASPTP